MIRFLAVFSAILQANPVTQQAASSLEGRVLRAGTVTPVNHAQILLTKLNGRLADSLIATADERGNFLIQNIPPGTYRLFGESEDYVRAEYGQRGPAQPGASLEFGPGEKKSGITFSLIPTGVISGRVVDRNGESASRIRVQALKSTIAEGKRTPGVAAAETQTNDLGEYRLFGLAPGSYFVSAMRYGFQQVEGGAMVGMNRPNLDALVSLADMRSAVESLTKDGSYIDSEALDGKAFSTLYYPGSADSATAQKLEVQPGSLLAGIDFQMIPMPASKTSKLHIRGQIIDGITGQAAENANATLHKPERPYALESRVQDLFNLPAGKFEFSDVSPGRYLISGNLGDKNGDIYVDVAGSDVENLRIVLTPRVTLSGRITVEGPIAVKPSPIIVYLQSPVISRQVSIADSTFTVPNLLGGQYQIRAGGGSSNYYLKAARLGDTDVLESGMRLESQPSQPLALVVSTNGGIVEGLVTEDVQRPAAGVVVVAVPDPAHRKSFDRYRTTVTNSSGRFHIEGLIPGEYKFFAWDEIAENEWQLPETMRQYEDQGTAIRVNEGTRESVNLRMIPRS